jgi:hypothetical protein
MDVPEPPSDDQSQAALDRIERRYAAFADSDHFEQLTRHQQREAEFVVETFHELLHGYEYVPLDDPDEESLESVCRQFYPAKISAEPDHFGAVAPVVASFLRFLDDQGELTDGDELATHVESLQDEIVEKAADPDNWGLAKSMFASGALEEVTHLDTESDVEEPSELTETPLDPSDLQTSEMSGTEDLLPPEEKELLDKALDSLSEESDAKLDALGEVMEEFAAGADPEVVLEQSEFSADDLDDVVDEVLEKLEDSDSELASGPGDATDPSVLDPEAAREFLNLQGQLLVYANERFDVVPGIDTYEEFRRAYIDDIRPIHEELYFEEDAVEVIEDFVRDNPADLSDEQLETVESWVDYEAGQFVLVEHLEDGTVFLDPEEPRAYKVTSVYESYAPGLPEEALPVSVMSVVLLPYEGQIVTNGLELLDPLAGMAMQMIHDDPEVLYEEAKHSSGIAETLPPTDDLDRSDAERLRFYTKNQENRERYADEIAELKDKTDELERIYHEQLGKANARRLGREFRDLGLEEAYVAIYDGQVVATAPTEKRLEEALSSIMPDGKADYPYVYHYDP